MTSLLLSSVLGLAVLALPGTVFAQSLSGSEQQTGNSAPATRNPLPPTASLQTPATGLQPTDANTIDINTVTPRSLKVEVARGSKFSKVDAINLPQPEKSQRPLVLLILATTFLALFIVFYKKYKSDNTPTSS